MSLIVCHAAFGANVMRRHASAADAGKRLLAQAPAFRFGLVVQVSPSRLRGHVARSGSLRNVFAGRPHACWGRRWLSAGHASACSSGSRETNTVRSLCHRRRMKKPATGCPERAIEILRW